MYSFGVSCAGSGKSVQAELVVCLCMVYAQIECDANEWMLLKGSLRIDEKEWNRILDLQENGQEDITDEEDYEKRRQSFSCARSACWTWWWWPRALTAGTCMNWSKLQGDGNNDNSCWSGFNPPRSTFGSIEKD